MSIGSELTRKDGLLKVTGGADYTADTKLPGLHFAVFATSPVANATITALDTRAAERAPGVARVMTHRNAPRVRPPGPPAAMGFLPLQSDQIHYEGQPIALVVADSLERATYAASLVRGTYDVRPARMNVREVFDATTPAVVFETMGSVKQGYDEPDTRTGDPDAALESAAARVRQRYTIGFRHHNPMEPSATIATWDGDRLTLYDATQHVWGVRGVMAQAFGLRPDDVRVVSHFLGGGFGCKGYVWPHEILTALVARDVRRPVKLVLTRAQMYAACGYQTETVHDVALGSSREGRLVAISHDVVYANAIPEDFPEYAAAGTRTLYACPAIATRHRVVKVNTIQPTAMRAPNEGMGNFALESAMDELAYELGIDPLELRLRNHAEHDPTTGKPYSSKKLREAYQLGAERFGWSRRPPQPRAMRDGQDLVGWGMATALMPTYRFPSSARVRMRADGSVIVEAGSQEIGTGVRTIMPQIAADRLGIDPRHVEMVLGDTTLPEAGPTYGSSSTMGVGSAVADAAAKLRLTLLRAAIADRASPLYEARLEDLEVRADGAIGAKGSPTRIDTYAAIVRRSGQESMAAGGSWSPGGGGFGESPYAMFTFGAVFAEVRVDADLGITHVARCVGAYSAGRVINPKTARSQMTGGMIWGIGQALLERSETDAALGRFVSKNLAGYLVPVNADIAHLEAYFVDEVDPHASALGAKGIGELGATGVAAAIANAVFHATGIRARELPIRPEMFLTA
jgi:xanthine dehydrogenase YagR molybdenum-binding subunit